MLKWWLDVNIIVVMINQKDNPSYEFNFNQFENLLNLRISFYVLIKLFLAIIIYFLEINKVNSD